MSQSCNNKIKLMAIKLPIFNQGPDSCKEKPSDSLLLKV